MYQFNSHKIVFEVFDGETVMINLENGSYYATNKTGSFLLELIRSQVDIQKEMDSLFLFDKITLNEIAHDIQEFTNKLRDENIIVEVESEDLDSTAISMDPQPYIRPEISCFSDMKELILLDPVHEVTDEGWPMQDKKG